MSRAVVIAALALAACPAPLRRPASTDVVISGSASWGGFTRRADPLAGAAVTLWAGATPTKATSAADGAFRLSAPAPRPVTATLSAWADGFAPRVSSLRVGESTELQPSFARSSSAVRCFTRSRSSWETWFSRRMTIARPRIATPPKTARITTRRRTLACTTAAARSIGRSTSSTPRTAPTFQSFFGESLCALWQVTHASCMRSATA